ncbi:MAG: GNAT family N-acetyltransferase [Leptotrichiaceae bacterium]|nr:GNAT family N-acetyltransferase [Leptotrichiaceae bacterium]MBP6281231.1 GNAT family N-acetyltransferase [Leptotrichiaceae bacterium]MBP7100167.1 GNAT family N-acetyltransferase [Leptotrichiaceae bacterium]MBP7725602.1 GNAT family N-acetyltransferase [Leptotrichiaceae bacterium]MBP9629989.1 GNAT family N-acetyltransferase [Leptotrichiaceae bacterium]
MEKKYIKKLLGDKVYLSPISLDDVEEYTQMINNNIVSVGLGSIVYAGVYDVEKELESLKKIKNEYTFSIRLLENDELLGSVGFNRIDLINKNAELGIMIGKENYYGKGYGKEAINLILDFGFSLLNLKNISLYVFEYNEIAYNLYKKIGFKEAGRFRKMIEVFGKRYDYIAMDILDEEFESHYIKKEIEKRYKIK